MKFESEYGCQQTECCDSRICYGRLNCVEIGGVTVCCRKKNT
jgi:hypothetical protein